MNCLLSRNLTACIFGYLFLTALVSEYSAAGVLLYDVNNGPDSTSKTQVGWTAATSSNGVTFSAVGSDVSIAYRDRDGTAGEASSDATNFAMWNDFIFANGSNLSGEGMNVEITGLLVNTEYNVQLWAYDDLSDPVGSAGITSQWNEAHNLTFLKTGDPSSLDDYTVTFTETTDANGMLQLRGRAVTTHAHNVFLNGFKLSAITTSTVPEPGSLIVWSAFCVVRLCKRRSRARK